MCELSVAFASAGHGLLHFWDQDEPWYQEFLTSQDAQVLHDADEERRISEEERDRQVTEVAEAILADPEFRASPPKSRRRRAQMLVPEGTDRRIGWEAADRASERAEELSDLAYRTVRDHLDDLVTAFAASPGWQRAALSGAKKKAAEQFLISAADGFYPPSFIRDDLYAKARRLPKSNTDELF